MGVVVQQYFDFVDQKNGAVLHILASPPRAFATTFIEYSFEKGPSRLVLEFFL